ncbi:MAG: AMP-binding protein [Acetobacteraceae bacterium]
MTDALFAPVRVERLPQPDGSVLLRSRDPLADYALRITDHLWHWAERAPDRPFLLERGNDGAWTGVTFAQAADAVRRLSQALLDRGLGPSRPLAVLSGNSVRHALLAFAAQAVGVPYTAVSEPYSLLSGDLGKLRHILARLRPALIFAEDATRFDRALAVPEAATAEIASADSWADLVATTPTPGLDRAMAGVDPDAPVKILFTSGSTGVPKGVVGTHRMMAANQQQILQVWPFLAQDPPVLVDWLPWSHVFGGSHNLNMVLRFGGTFHIDAGRPLPGQFDATLANLRDTAATIRFDVPRGHALLLPVLEADTAFARHFFQRLRLLFSAGAAMPEAQFLRLRALAATHASRPVPVVSSWGLTETAPAATTTHVLAAQPSEIGTPLPGVDLRLVPVDGKLEIRVRGPNVFPGYLDEPEANAAAFDDQGYFRTGDAVAWVDEADPTRGLRFDGRLAEDFKLLSGTKINALELRLRVLAAMGGIARDVVVVGADRDDVGVLVFPANPADAETATFREAVRAALAKANEAAGGGSSRLVARALVLAEPPSLDAGEVTDKGSLNVRAIQVRRKSEIDGMYAGADGTILLAI